MQSLGILPSKHNVCYWTQQDVCLRRMTSFISTLLFHGTNGLCVMHLSVVSVAVAQGFRNAFVCTPLKLVSQTVTLLCLLDQE